MVGPQVGEPELIVPSPARFSVADGIGRTAPRPLELQQLDYLAGYDSRTLFFDAYSTGRRVVLSGPPLLDLSSWVSQCTFSVDGRTVVEGTFTDLDRTQRSFVLVPPGTSAATEAPTTLDITGPGRTFSLRIGPDGTGLFEGRRVITTLSKDNPLEWVREWATFYVLEHGADAVLLYDNGSTRYSSQELLACLAGVPGIRQACVVEWPFPYGPGGGPGNRWDSDYCQYGYFEHARGRFLRRAAGVVNCDIDELALRRGTETLYQAAAESPVGTVLFVGSWVEDLESPGPASATYPTFSRFHHLDRAAGDCLAKWALVPRRVPPSAQWAVHRVTGVSADEHPGFRLRHFKGVNTRWKRAAAVVTTPGDAHEVDAEWIATLKQHDESRPGTP